MIYLALGKYDDALVIWQKARQVLVTVYGLNHPDVANIDLNMGSAYCKMCNDEKAMECYNYALPVYEKAYGIYHPDVANIKVKALTCLNLP